MNVINTLKYYVSEQTDSLNESFSGSVTGENYQNRLHLHEILENETDIEKTKYITDQIDLNKEPNILLYGKKNIYHNNLNHLSTIINLVKINDVKQLDNYFRSVNSLLPDSGIYIGTVETYWGRKLKIYNKFPLYMAKFIWLFDFAFTRVLPRLKLFSKIYHILTNGRCMALSRAEILGRLVYNGFRIVNFHDLSDKNMMFTAVKANKPRTDKYPTFYPLIKLARIGKDGKLIRVYKFRTMHPYSEFIQDIVIKLNGYNDVGKPADDFRMTRWGKFMRKYWLDEIPQLINVLKGELGIVGVRPLSIIRFEELPEKIQEKRVKYKPGCIPPYVSLNMPDSVGNVIAEDIYMKDKEKHPHTTDIRYFFMALKNILTNRIVSG